MRRIGLQRRQQQTGFDRQAVMQQGFQVQAVERHRRGGDGAQRQVAVAAQQSFQAVSVQTIQRHVQAAFIGQDARLQQQMTHAVPAAAAQTGFPAHDVFVEGDPFAEPVAGDIAAEEITRRHRIQSLGELHHIGHGLLPQGGKIGGVAVVPIRRTAAE